jgi:hypothetical protein
VPRVHLPVATAVADGINNNRLTTAYAHAGGQRHQVRSQVPVVGTPATLTIASTPSRDSRQRGKSKTRPNS